MLKLTTGSPSQQFGSGGMDAGPGMLLTCYSSNRLAWHANLRRLRAELLVGQNQFGWLARIPPDIHLHLGIRWERRTLKMFLTFLRYDTCE